MIRILMVDDHPAVRTGLRHLIEGSGDLKIVAEAATGEEAVALAEISNPNVILMDLSLPGMTGVEATRRIVEADQEAAVLVLTAHDDRERPMKAIAAGAIGYILKDIEPAELLEAIRCAARGESPLDPRVARALIDATSGEHPAGALSTREREVLVLVTAGLANKQIARRLAISEKTVKNHLTRIYGMIGVTGRTQAAMWAAEHGLADPT